MVDQSQINLDLILSMRDKDEEDLLHLQVPGYAPELESVGYGGYAPRTPVRESINLPPEKPEKKGPYAIERGPGGEITGAKWDREGMDLGSPGRIVGAAWKAFKKAGSQLPGISDEFAQKLRKQNIFMNKPDWGIIGFAQTVNELAIRGVSSAFYTPPYVFNVIAEPIIKGFGQALRELGLDEPYIKRSEAQLHTFSESAAIVAGTRTPSQVRLDQIKRLSLIHI